VTIMFAGKTCIATAKNSSPCKAPPLLNSDYCFFHDPGNSEVRKIANSNGGKRGKVSTLPTISPDLPLNSAQDILSLLSESINQVRRGDIDPRIANAVGYLSALVLKAREQYELEERIRKLEGIAKQLAETPQQFPPELSLFKYVLKNR